MCTYGEVDQVTGPGGLSLARVTIVAPTRRLDVALPDNMAVAELLPHLLRHAGDDLGDAGDRHGGWVLRRATGAILEPVRNLSAQGVRDGELLHLAPGRDDWPELAYDDVVEVIASGARHAARSWGRGATRACGLAVSSALFGLGAVVLALTAGPTTTLGVGALGLATLLTMTGSLLSRAFADARAGAVVAASGLPYGFLGGVLLAPPAGAQRAHLSAGGLLLGAAVLLTFSVIGYVSVGSVQRLFMAGAVIGVVGMLAAALWILGVSAGGAAAVALTVVIGLLPGYPLVASWFGRLPVPALPDRPEDILEDHPVPRRADVFTAVARATELLTGMLLAAAVVGAIAIGFLTVVAGSRAGSLLALAAAAALLLRARLFAAPQQRLPLLISGLIGLILLGFGLVPSGSSVATGMALMVILIVVAVAVLAAGLVYSRKAPTPYLGRAADILDVVAIMALIPLACGVLGLYTAIQGLFASIGG
jgi:type VII secretion integral membrane protein EccD